MRPYSEALLSVVVELRPACMFAERSPPGAVDRDKPRHGMLMSTLPLDDAAQQGQAQQQREAITAGLGDYSYRGYSAGTDAARN